MSDYIVQFRIKNAPMMRLMKKQGYDTAAALSRASGVSQVIIGEYLNLKRAPIRDSGEFSEMVYTLAAYLRCNPEDMFPEQHLRRALKKNTVYTEMSLNDCAQISSDFNLDDTGIENALKKAISVARLTVRDVNILSVRSETNTDVEAANRLGVTTTRVRQVREKANRRLRHPKCQKYLKYYCEKII